MIEITIQISDEETLENYSDVDPQLIVDDFISDPSRWLKTDKVVVTAGVYSRDDLIGYERDQADIDFEKAFDSSGIMELDEQIEALVEKSERHHQGGNGMDPKKHPFKYEVETLYRAPDGGLFLHCKGGGMSQYAVEVAGNFLDGQKIKEWNTEQAVQWLKENNGEHLVSKL